MSAYEGLVAQATAALNECDESIQRCKRRIEELKQEIVGSQLERRKIAALIPSAEPTRRVAPGRQIVMAPYAPFECEECGRGFGSAQAIAMHGTRSGHATGHVRGQSPAVPSEPVDEPLTPVDEVAVDEVVVDTSAPVRAEAEVVADVLAYWAETGDEMPLDRARKVGVLTGLSSSDVRNIVRQHSTASVA